jgi:hypothetical protein
LCRAKIRQVAVLKIAACGFAFGKRRVALMLDFPAGLRPTKAGRLRLSRPTPAI